MRAVAHGWKPGGRKPPPIAVAKEFVRADKRRKRTIASGDNH